MPLHLLEVNTNLSLFLISQQVNTDLYSPFIAQ